MYFAYLEETRMHFPFYLHAYCLMTNHIHLLLETKDHPTAAIMKHMHAKYATYFNRRYELSGHLFQGRYGGSLIKDDAHFLQVSRYIHLNPVKAGLARRPHHYPWSSCRALVTSIPDPHISLTRTLSSFPSPQPFHYQQYIEENIQGGSFHDSINE